MTGIEKGPLAPIVAKRARWLQEYRFRLRVTEQGSLVSIGDGIAWIWGLPSAAMDEMLNLEGGRRAMVFHLGQDLLGAILLEHSDTLSAGAAAYLSGKDSASRSVMRSSGVSLIR